MAKHTKCSKTGPLNRTVAFKVKSGRGFIVRHFKARAKACAGTGGTAKANAWRKTFAQAGRSCKRMGKVGSQKRAACVHKKLA